jgi:hypothetical protein
MSGFPAELGPSPSPDRREGGAVGIPSKGRRVFLGNFTCELEWGQQWFDSEPHQTAAAGGSLLVSLTDRLRPLSAELAWSWLPLVQPGDLVLGIEPPARLEPAPWFPFLPQTRWQGVEFRKQLPEGVNGTLVPWGWTPAAQDLAGRLGRPVAIPPLAVVARVNSRVQRWSWEHELEMTLPGSRVIASLHELSPALRDLPDPAAGWILKANFGMSGREAIRGTGDTITEPQRRFVEQRLAATGPVVLEPLLNAVAEAGVQWELSANGTIALVGLAEQVAAGGSWQGSRWSSEPVPPTWREAIEATHLVAQRVVATGYFGPLGIDVMRYRDAAGHERLRPLQDLNARFTMGRLTLAWRDWLPPGWSGLWRVSSGAAAAVVRQFCEEISRSGDREVVAWLTTPVFSRTAPVPGERESPQPPDPSLPRGSPAKSRAKSMPAVRVLLAAADPVRLRRLEEQLAWRTAGVAGPP